MIGDSVPNTLLGMGHLSSGWATHGAEIELRSLRSLKTWPECLVQRSFTHLMNFCVAGFSSHENKSLMSSRPNTSNALLVNAKVTLDPVHPDPSPKPPSLKEQALEQLRTLDQHEAIDCNTDKIRRALEALDD